MNVKRIFLASIIIGMMITVASAQAQLRGNRGSVNSSNQTSDVSPQAASRDDAKIKAAGNQSAATSNDSDDGLVGSWRATFTPVAGNPVQFPPLPALFTFTSDGTLVETDGGSLVPFMDTFGSPGHGVWRKTGRHKFEMKNIIIVVNSDGTLFLTGTIRLTVQLSADGDSFQGGGTFSFVDPNGVDFGSGPENISGQRIKLN
jgi:hypothetical protein